MVSFSFVFSTNVHFLKKMVQFCLNITLPHLDIGMPLQFTQQKTKKKGWGGGGCEMETIKPPGEAVLRKHIIMMNYMVQLVGFICFSVTPDI